MSTKACLVLLPGAFHGSWCFKYIIPILSELKYQCITIDYPRTFYPNPAVTVDHYFQHTLNQLQTISHNCSLPLFLVCHSLGGLIGTNCAELCSQNINGIIHIASAAFQNGKTGNSTILRHPAVNLKLRQKGIQIIDNEQRLKLRDEYIHEMLYNDCDDEQKIEWITSQLVPEILYGTYSAKWTLENYGTIPKLYIQCARDNMITLPIQQHICDGLGLTKENGNIIEMDTSHSPWLSQPHELVNNIDSWIRNVLFKTGHVYQ
eukprot:413360_1